MHKLNFCTSLCLPEEIEGYEVRGINALHEFDEAFVIAMAGIATPLHILYSSRPITKRGKILQFDELNTPSKVDRVKNALAPDCAVDPDPRCDALFDNRDKNLQYIVERLFEDGHERVVIWSNNGIGDDADGSAGILRDNRGVAYGILKDGKESPHHEKGLPNSYQNTAHDHIHIAPDATGLAEKVEAELCARAGRVEQGTFEQYRQVSKDRVPCISVCVIDRGSYYREKPLVHTFYSDIQFREGENAAGFVRNTVLGVSEQAGLDFSDKETAKKYIKETEEYYGRILQR